MKAASCLFILALGLFSACTKKDLTQTRVGFYVLQPDYQPGPDEPNLQLYIDNQYKGELAISAVETLDSNLLNFQTLDASRHVIEVRKNQVVNSSTYLHIRRCGAASGASGTTLGKTVGAKYNAPSNLGFSTYAIFSFP